MSLGAGRTLAATAALVVFTGAAGQAATLSVEELLSQYNGITSGDYFSQQEVEGRLYVGGNLTGSTIQTGFKQPLPAGAEENVVVVGDATIGAITGSGKILIGGNSSSNIEQSGGTLETRVGGTFTGRDNFGTVTDELAGDADFQASFPQIDFDAVRDYSIYLSGLTGETLTFSDPNIKAFNVLNNAVQAEGINWDASSVTVLHTSLADISSGTFLTNIGAGETMIINVSGTSGTFGLNPTGSADVSQRILWNFYEAEDVEITRAIYGSVLAPLAELSNFSGSTEGSVLAASIRQTNGELHLQSFAGDIPDAPAGVPVPAGLPLLLTGLGGIWLLRRRSGAR
ncbi:MAG: collagen-binding domain-containing protein [Pseudomonadota bacterium]